MKTLEQKAQAYDEALEKAKKLYEQGTITESLSYVFPELKESEDEKIRNALITFFQRFPYDSIEKAGTNAKEAIAWLEKQGSDFRYPTAYDKVQTITTTMEAMKKQSEQNLAIFIPKFRVGDKLFSTKNPRLTYEVLEVGHINELGNPEYKVEIFIDGKVQNPRNIHNIECRKLDEWAKLIEQKPADKVEPKFHEGDWVVWQDKCYKVNYNGCGYKLIDQNGLSTSLEYGTVDTSARLWDITKDAKDGDVLYSPCLNLLWIFKSRDTVYCGCNLNYNDGAFCGEGYFERPNDAIPATREQCDTLFDKMREAGYTFDFEKKEMKKIHIIDEGKAEMDYCFTKMMNGKKASPAWSEEDEETLGWLCTFLKDYGHPFYEGNEENVIDWLKSIKERITWKPSDEQMKAFEHFVRSIGESGYVSPYENKTKLLYSLLNDLKKLIELIYASRIIKERYYKSSQRRRTKS